MIPEGINQDFVTFHTVNKAMFPLNPPRPEAIIKSVKLRTNKLNF
jgi:hypothetical protein